MRRVYAGATGIASAAEPMVSSTGGAKSGARIAPMRFIPVAFALAAAVGCSAPTPPPPPDTRAADEAAIRAADEEWAKSAVQKNVDTWMSHYTDDVVALPPNEPAAAGKEAVRKLMTGFLASPGLSVTWKVTSAQASKSGDLGYTHGTYEMTMNDAKGKPMSDHGKYLEVWKKQADGSWKCTADMFSSDLPAAPAK